MSRRAAVVVVALVAVAIVTTVGFLVARRDVADAGERVVGVGPQGAIPQFVVECPWSHRAADDPIVHPYHAGAGHLHDFFGNTSTAADSTLGSLLAAGTTCEQKADTAAYWAPALYDRGEVVQPIGSVAYYRPGPGIDPAAVEPYPPGLFMIGGDASSSGPQPVAVAAWRCGRSPRLAPEPPVCPARAPLSVRVVFPDCWDGRRIDSPDHRAHVARSRGGVCPDTHPVPVPQLIFEVQYPIHGDGHHVELSSDGVQGLHADFINAWDQRALEREIHACLNLENVCGVVPYRATG